MGAIFVLSIGVGLIATQEGGRVPLLPDQVAAATGIYDFTWAPDGKSIAFVSTRNAGTEIWSVPTMGGASRRITSTAMLKKQPRWSKDGKWITYVVVQPGNLGDLHIVSADGETAITLTDTAGDERDPAWSPDGKQLAFVERLAGRTYLAVIDIESRAVQRLAETPASDLQWSGDGKSIAFVADPLLPSDDRRDNEDLFVITPSEGSMRLLTPGTPRFREFAPSWSPDSRQLAYASDEAGFSNIYVMDVESGRRRAFTTGAIEHLSPKWSPDGKQIAYVTNEDSQFNIWVAPAEGGRATRISDRDGTNGGFESRDSSPRGRFQWSPDSRRIAFTHSDP
ncbi:MAG: PD40 domain-containing protein, partial [Acidobacteria bacterium]|nr:PD40 domain-containing protein [Acidobacteriota bacterium]